MKWNLKCRKIFCDLTFVIREVRRICARKAPGSERMFDEKLWFITLDKLDRAGIIIPPGESPDAAERPIWRCECVVVAPGDGPPARCCESEAGGVNVNDGTWLASSSVSQECPPKMAVFIALFAFYSSSSTSLMLKRTKKHKYFWIFVVCTTKALCTNN